MVRLLFAIVLSDILGSAEIGSMKMAHNCCGRNLCNFRSARIVTFDLRMKGHEAFHSTVGYLGQGHL